MCGELRFVAIGSGKEVFFEIFWGKYSDCFIVI